ncbi:MAG: Holliday junction resolvase-like protein [Chloroflexota bacterium]
MLDWALPIALSAALVLVAWRYHALQAQVEQRARGLHDGWRQTELAQQTRERAELLFAEWAQAAQRDIRADAIKQSAAVIRGKATEHLMPYLPGFGYNPQDARFLGTPVDFVVFDGLSEGDVRRIVFVEVKTGRAPALSAREKLVRRCIRQQSVSYDVIHVEGNGREASALAAPADASTGGQP